MAQRVGETSGDIPLYSLHRISNALRRHPPPLSPELLRMLSCRLIAANSEYREESGNNWNCLTPTNLIDALEELDGDIKNTIKKATTITRELSQAEERIKQALEARRKIAMQTAKEWFDEQG